MSFIDSQYESNVADNLQMSLTATKKNRGLVQYMLGLVVYSNGGELMKESIECSRQERERSSYQDFDMAFWVFKLGVWVL